MLHVQARLSYRRKVLDYTPSSNKTQMVFRGSSTQPHIHVLCIHIHTYICDVVDTSIRPSIM